MNVNEECKEMCDKRISYINKRLTFDIVLMLNHFNYLNLSVAVAGSASLVFGYKKNEKKVIFKMHYSQKEN